MTAEEISKDDIKNHDQWESEPDTLTPYLLDVVTIADR
jgi:hypothetical protein